MIVVPDLASLAVFVAAALVLLLTPGPAVLYIVARSIDQGRRAGLVSMLGVHVGTLVHVGAAAAGVSALLAASATAFSAVKYLGAGYLVYLGIRRLRHRTPAIAPGTPSRRRLRRAFLDGVVVNVLNPKTALFFLAFLPQFIDHAVGSGAISFLFLGSTFMVTGTIWCMIIALCASAFAEVLRDNPKNQRGFDLFAGILFIGMGAAILLIHL